MRAVLWSDYICPWCYLGRDRTALLESLDVTVDHRSFDLHPEMPPSGVEVRAGGRLDSVLHRIADECDEAGLPFRIPTHLPRSRRAIETAEVVRATAPRSFRALDEALFHAVFVAPRDISDIQVLGEIVEAAAAPVDDVLRDVAEGVGSRLVEETMAEARGHGIVATPSWLVDEQLVIPGALPRDQIARWIQRMRARTP